MWLWTLCSVLLAARESASEKATCYQHFDAQQGSCSRLLGEAEVDDCCLNPHYGYKDSSGVCHSCRPASWTDWTPWGPCTRSCQEGVQQRRRYCYGLGTCTDPHRLGSLQTRPCEIQSCCPEQGGWAEWGQWQPCSVSCETGRKVRERTCSAPPPVCGGSCSGPATEYAPCDTGKVCPVHGSWSIWSDWESCAASCRREGSAPPQRYRVRTCTNPAPSTSPPGLPCPGPNRGVEECTGLPYCSVDGAWGSWSSNSECSVTCGLGLKEWIRACDNPSPRHGGQNCPGHSSSNQICNTRIHCPVNGEWSEWGEWSRCGRALKDIHCTVISAGRQSRIRTCLHRDWNGTFCPGSIRESRSCYDIEGCKFYGNWSEWSAWSNCEPSCGSQAQKTRVKKCNLNFDKYKDLEVGRTKEKAVLAGKPLERCPRLPETEKIMKAPCLNVPPCINPALP